LKPAADLPGPASLRLLATIYGRGAGRNFSFVTPRIVHSRIVHSLHGALSVKQRCA